MFLIRIAIKWLLITKWCWKGLQRTSRWPNCSSTNRTTRCSSWMTRSRSRWARLKTSSRSWRTWRSRVKSSWRARTTCRAWPGGWPSSTPTSAARKKNWTRSVGSCSVWKICTPPSKLRSTGISSRRNRWALRLPTRNLQISSFSTSQCQIT